MIKLWTEIGQRQSHEEKVDVRLLGHSGVPANSE